MLEKIKEFYKSPLVWALTFACADLVGVFQLVFGGVETIKLDFMIADFSIWTAAVLIIIAIRREKK